MRKTHQPRWAGCADARPALFFLYNIPTPLRHPPVKLRAGSELDSGSTSCHLDRLVRRSLGEGWKWRDLLVIFVISLLLSLESK